MCVCRRRKTPDSSFKSCFFSTLLFSLIEMNTLRCSQRYALYPPAVSMNQQEGHRKTRRTFFCTHTRRSELHAHTSAKPHTPRGPCPPFHGCLSHILSFCLVSLSAKRRKDGGQDGDAGGKKGAPVPPAVGTKASRRDGKNYNLLRSTAFRGSQTEKSTFEHLQSRTVLLFWALTRI